jgi:hypothetical protein
VNCTFLVFDFVGRNAGFETKGSPHGFIHPKFDDSEEAIGFVFREKG